MKFTEAFLDELAKIGGPVVDAAFAGIERSKKELAGLQQRTKKFREEPSATTGKPRKNS
jgi:glutamate dehydrogenase/leucine dehydrogenase